MKKPRNFLFEEIMEMLACMIVATVATVIMLASLIIIGLIIGASS